VFWYFILYIFLFLLVHEWKTRRVTTRDAPRTCATCEIYTLRLPRRNLYLSRGPSGVVANLIRLKRQIFVSQRIDTPGGCPYQLCVGSICGYMSCVGSKAVPLPHGNAINKFSPSSLRGLGPKHVEGMGGKRSRRRLSAIELRLIFPDLICAAPAIVLPLTLRALLWPQTAAHLRIFSCCPMQRA